MLTAPTWLCVWAFESAVGDRLLAVLRCVARLSAVLRCFACLSAVLCCFCLPFSRAPLFSLAFQPCSVVPLAWLLCRASTNKLGNADTSEARGLSSTELSSTSSHTGRSRRIDTSSAELRLASAAMRARRAPRRQRRACAA
eukprot:358814-Chlamydomonas_euryale.AAC.3